MANDSSPRLLVVDGVPDNCAILNRAFSRVGYRVSEAQTGAAALAAIAAETFDAVLLDMALADPPAVELLERIRLHHSVEQLPVIVASAATHNKDLVDSLLAGANDYIAKPIDLQVARARIEAQVKRKRTDDRVLQGHRELQDSLSALRGRILISDRVAGGDARVGALDVANVLARVCDRPELRETIDLIDKSLATLRRLAPPAPAALLPDGRIDYGRVRILSADGAQAERQAVRVMLDETPAKVDLVEVSDGAEAVAAAIESAFDLIIMGLAMPGMDGLTAIKKIREREARSGLSRTPILAVSPTADSAALAIRAGADLHMVKPVTAMALMNAVVRTLSQGPEPMQQVA